MGRGPTGRLRLLGGMWRVRAVAIVVAGSRPGVETAHESMQVIAQELRRDQHGGHLGQRVKGNITARDRRTRHIAIAVRSRPRALVCPEAVCRREGTESPSRATAQSVFPCTFVPQQASASGARDGEDERSECRATTDARSSQMHPSSISVASSARPEQKRCSGESRSSHRACMNLRNTELSSVPPSNYL